MASDASSADTGREKVQIWSHLHQTEISANIGELQSGSSLILGSLAYFAATVLLVRDADLSFEFLLLLPLGVLFLCSYHLLRTAVVVRRARLARYYEQELFAALGDEEHQAFESGQIGSPYYGQIDDVGLLLARRPRGWVVSVVVATFSYFGLYGLALLYAAIVLEEAWQRSGSDQIVVLAGLGYLALFVIYTAFAGTAFLKRQPEIGPPASFAENAQEEPTETAG